MTNLAFGVRVVRPETMTCLTLDDEPIVDLDLVAAAIELEAYLAEGKAHGQTIKL
jgi:hypothetical protein